MDSTNSRSEWVSGTAAVATGLGVLTVALFPLAIPILILTIVALIPLAAPLVVVAAVGAIFAGVWILLRTIGRGARRLARRPDGEGVAAKPHPEAVVPRRQRALG
jgi:hypothetical protein